MKLVNGVWVYLADESLYRLVQKNSIFIKQDSTVLIISPTDFKTAKKTVKYEKIPLTKNGMQWVLKWVYRCDLTEEEASEYLK